MLPRSHKGSFRHRRGKAEQDMITIVHQDKLPSGMLDKLRRANAAHGARYPGEPASRQPVHVVYGGAHLFKEPPLIEKRMVLHLVGEEWLV